MSRAARILVVDDDAAVLRTMQRVLQPHYEVCCANSPLNGAELARDFAPDIAICDIQMPHMNGFELLDTLRTSAPDLDVILMTGSITDQDQHLIRALRERAFYFILKPFERDVLLALIERCAEMRRLRHAEQGHLRRMRDELGAAQAFQQAMFAPRCDQCAGARVDVLYKPCSEVGGDFYDYVQTPAGELAFILADVRGHGVPAALLTAMVKSVFRNIAMRGESPAHMARALVQSLQYFRESEFITAFCGKLARNNGHLEYVNAGHPPALVVDAQHIHLLHAESPFLCSIFPPDSWNNCTTQLSSKAALFVHTDGFCTGLPCETATLTQQAAKAMRSSMPGDDMLQALVQIAATNPDTHNLPADDVTLMLITRE